MAIDRWALGLPHPHPHPQGHGKVAPLLVDYQNLYFKPWTSSALAPPLKDPSVLARHSQVTLSWTVLSTVAPAAGKYT